MQFDEIIEFLGNNRLDVRELAAKTIASYSENADLLRKCQISKKFTLKLVRLLLRGIGGDSSLLCQQSLLGLVNLSCDKHIIDALIEQNAIRMLMDSLKDVQRNKLDAKADEIVLLHLMLLTNLTRNEKGREQFLDVNDENLPSTLSELFIHRLIKMFLQSSSTKTIIAAESEDPYIYAGHILVNLTCVAAGRCAITQTPEDLTNLLEKLSAKLLLSFSHARRTVTLQLILHLAIDYATSVSEADKESADWRVAVKYLLCLVYPPKGSVKRRFALSPVEGKMLGEKDIILEKEEERIVDAEIDNNSCGLIEPQDLRKLILDIFYELMRVAGGRNVMRQATAYNVFRVWHLLETDSQIKAGIENVVHLLVYDEEELAAQDSSLQITIT